MNITTPKLQPPSKNLFPILIFHQNKILQRISCFYFLAKSHCPFHLNLPKTYYKYSSLTVINLHNYLLYIYNFAIYSYIIYIYTKLICALNYMQFKIKYFMNYIHIIGRRMQIIAIYILANLLMLSFGLTKL